LKNALKLMIGKMAREDRVSTSLRQRHAIVWADAISERA